MARQKKMHCDNKMSFQWNQLGWGCLVPLSTIFQLYHWCQR